MDRLHLKPNRLFISDRREGRAKRRPGVGRRTGVLMAECALAREDERRAPVVARGVAPPRRRWGVPISGCKPPKFRSFSAPVTSIARQILSPGAGVPPTYASQEVDTGALEGEGLGDPWPWPWSWTFVQDQPALQMGVQRKTQGNPGTAGVYQGIPLV
jgi:hypothetical protein